MVSLLLFAMVLLATASFGPGVSPDSVYYLSAARSVVEGMGLQTFEGEPMTQWPPLYPWLLALGPLAGLEMIDWARILGAGLSTATLWIAGRWCARRLESDLVFAVSPPFLALAPPLFIMGSTVWSESLFVFLVTVSLIQAQSYLETGGRRHWGIAAVAAGLGLLTRWAGVVLSLSIAATLLLHPRHRPSRRLRDAGAFLAVASTPAGLWLLRNWTLSTGAAGPRPSAEASLVENLKSSVYHVSQWFFPLSLSQIGSVVSAALLAGLSFALVLLGLRLLVKRRFGVTLTLLPFVLFAVGFWAFHLCVASMTAIDPLGTRLMSPIFLPLAFIVFVVADEITRGIERPARRRLWSAAVVLLFGWPIATWGFRNLQAIQKYRNAGFAGYTTSSWHLDELAEHLGSLPPGTLVFSNAPDAVYHLSERRSQWSPRRTFYRSNDRPRGSLRRFVADVCSSPSSHLVWFDATEREFLYDEHRLLQTFGESAQLLARSNGARIYRLGCPAIDQNGASTSVGPEPSP